MDTSLNFNTPQNSRNPNQKVAKLFHKLAVLVLLLLLCGKSKSLICPSSITSSTSASTQDDTFSSYSGISAYNVEVGPVSNALYVMYFLASSTTTAFVKLNYDGTKAWSKSVNFHSLIRSLAVDKTENSVYFIMYNFAGTPMIVMRLKASDGTLIDAQNHPSFFSYYDDTKVHVMSDNSGYYVIQLYTGNTPHVLKYSFSSPTTNQHYILNSMYIAVFGTLMISDTELFCITRTSTSPYNAVFVKLTFASISADWTNQMSCSTGDCDINCSESLLSTDKLKIYTLFSYYQPNNWNIYFSCFQTSNGAIVGNRYQSTSCSNFHAVYGFVQSGDNIVGTLQCSSFYLVIYNIPSDSFTFKSFSGGLYDVAIEGGSNRLIVVGAKSAGYVAKFPFGSLAQMTDFTAMISISMSIYTDTVTSLSVTLTSQSDTVTDYTSSVTVHDVTYSSTIQYTSDYYSQTNNQAYSLFENSTITETPDLTCSYSGSTSITYSIANYLTQAPSWVTLDSTIGQLSITAPNVTADTTYSFFINSAVSGISNPVQKLISVMVLNCAVEFCSTCSSSSLCSACNSGYRLTSSGTCSQQVQTSKTSKTSETPETSETAKALLTSTQAMAGFSLSISVIFSLVNTSTISNFWSAINQIQILNLLLLSRAYLPEDVKTVIKGSNLLANPTSLVPIQSNYLYKLMAEKFDSKCSNPHFKEFGLDANSSVLNIGSFFITLIFLIILHVFVIFLKKIVDSWCLCNFKCNPITALKWILDKCMIIMTYGYYIRFIMQMHQLLLVFSVYEIYSFNLSNLFNIISFVFAILILILCLSFAGVILHLSLSSYETSEEEHNKIGEFFIGIKMEKRYKFFVTALVLRRILFAILLISLMSISSKLLIIILCFFQILYLIYVIVTRPYKEIKSNIIEIINETYFLIFLASLIFLNEENDWNSTKTLIYCYAITSNTFVMMIIIMIDAFKVLIIKLKEWLCKSSEPASGVIQLTPEFLSRIGAPLKGKVVPLPHNATQTETEIIRNQRYMNEENKADIEDVISEFRLERRKL